MTEARINFGFHRTECACEECVLNCRFIPGYLIPTDLADIARHLGADNLLSFAIENLLASPGAIVMAEGRMLQIPTLVPARQPNGACKFLTAENHCAIHAVSPYGCSHFDVHQSNSEADIRSIAGLQTIAHEWMIGGVYAKLWTILRSLKLVAPSPLEARSKLKMAVKTRNHQLKES